jgi:hypothetical protein
MLRRRSRALDFAVQADVFLADLAHMLGVEHDRASGRAPHFTSLIGMSAACWTPGFSMMMFSISETPELLGGTRYEGLAR